MSPALRIGAFLAALAVVGAGAALAGGALDPDAPGGEASADAGGAHASGASRADGARQGGAGGGHAEGAPAPAAAAPGLAVAEGGLRLVAERTTFDAGERASLRFRIVDARGRTVRDFDLEHERRMHLIVVRRDLTGYQHLHPRQARDGSWQIGLELREAGSYRAFADFTRGGRGQTLGIDLAVAGAFRPRRLPAPSAHAHAGDGYEVELAEREGELRFTVRRDGRPVTDVEPYLGARGHLVALREGDLAYLHVHPQSAATAGADVRFAVEYPSPGRYRLFLQFKHEGQVRTAAFTRERGRSSAAGRDDGGEAGDGHGH